MKSSSVHLHFICYLQNYCICNLKSQSPDLWQQTDFSQVLLWGERWKVLPVFHQSRSICIQNISDCWSYKRDCWLLNRRRQHSLWQTLMCLHQTVGGLLWCRNTIANIQIILFISFWSTDLTSFLTWIPVLETCKTMILMSEMSHAPEMAVKHQTSTTVITG